MQPDIAKINSGKVQFQLIKVMIMMNGNYQLSDSGPVVIDQPKL